MTRTRRNDSVADGQLVIPKMLRDAQSGCPAGEDQPAGNHVRRLGLRRIISPQFCLNAAFDIHGQPTAMGVQHNPHILTLESLACPECLAKQVDVAMIRNLADESHPSSSNGQLLGWSAEALWQLLAASVLIFGS